MNQEGISREEFEAFLAGAVKRGASDIHLKTGSPPVLRMDGVLKQIKSSPMTNIDMEAVAGYILAAKIDPPSLKKLTQIDLPYSIEKTCRFRVNIFKQRQNISVVLRNIPMDIPTFKSLGLPPVIRKMAEETSGLILVTGATGSGKSSTLAAMINHINQTSPVHIITIEDPIEFVHRDNTATVSQREVGADTESFNDALRAALRQDPDVILVGEIRDHETIDIALKASETGHLVMSTLHTPDAEKALAGCWPCSLPKSRSSYATGWPTT
jgi:twitching motility protein PilT